MNYVVKDSFASQDSVTAQGLVSWETTSFYFTENSSRSGEDTTTSRTSTHLHRLCGTLHSWQDTSVQKDLKILISDLEGSKYFH